jgi:hypothetical protein
MTSDMFLVLCFHRENANLQTSPRILMQRLFCFQFLCAFQVEGSVVHIMKALARHPGAAQTLAECDRFQYMFHMVVMGGTTPLLSPSKSRSFKSAPPVHLAQLYRHVLQVGSRSGHLLISMQITIKWSILF